MVMVCAASDHCSPMLEANVQAKLGDTPLNGALWSPAPSPRSNCSVIAPHDPDTVIVIANGFCNRLRPLPWLATLTGRLIDDTEHGSGGGLVDVLVDVVVGGNVVAGL